MNTLVRVSPKRKRITFEDKIEEPLPGCKPQRDSVVTYPSGDESFTDASESSWKDFAYSAAPQPAVGHSFSSDSVVLSLARSHTFSVPLYPVREEDDLHMERLSVASATSPPVAVDSSHEAGLIGDSRDLLNEDDWTQRCSPEDQPTQDDALKQREDYSTAQLVPSASTALPNGTVVVLVAEDSSVSPLGELLTPDTASGAKDRRSDDQKASAARLSSFWNETCEAGALAAVSSLTSALGISPPSDVSRRLEFDSPGRAEHLSAAAEGRESICVLCRGAASHFPMELNSSVEGYPLHTLCALWAPEVYYDTETSSLVNVPQCLERSRNLWCGVCGETGASIGCAEQSCTRNFHFPCALTSKGELHLQTLSLRCYEHTKNNT